MTANHLGVAEAAATPDKYALCNSTTNFDYFTSGLAPGTGITLPRHSVSGGKWQTSMRGTINNSSIPYTSDLSVEMVINTTESAYNFFGGPYAHGVLGGSGYLWAWNVCIEPYNHTASDTTGRVRFQTWDVANTYQTMDSGLITDGLNHHVAVVSGASGGTAYLYVDGVLANSGAVYRRGDMDVNTFSVGDDGSFGGLCYRDYISHVALYNRALTAAEIAQRAALVRLPEAGQLVYSGSSWVGLSASKQYSTSWANRDSKIWDGSSWVRA